MIGDDFLYTTYGTLQGLKTEAYIKQTTPPFCYEYYNVAAWYQTSISTVPAITRIYNSLIEALNEQIHLPKYVVIVIDKDIVVPQLKKNIEATEIITDQIYWLVRQISRTILARREDLKIHTPDSVSTEPTTIVWVKMLTGPITENSSLRKMRKLGMKFNDAMDTILISEKYMRTLTVKNMEEDIYFDIRGNLTTSGKRIFWQNLNNELKAIDGK